MRGEDEKIEIWVWGCLSIISWEICICFFAYLSVIWSIIFSILFCFVFCFVSLRVFFVLIEFCLGETLDLFARQAINPLPSFQTRSPKAGSIYGEEIKKWFVEETTRLSGFSLSVRYHVDELSDVYRRPRNKYILCTWTVSIDPCQKMILNFYNGDRCKNFDEETDIKKIHLNKLSKKS